MPSARSRSFKGPRFVCDEQLGRLARWLRLQGFDTLFECPMDDSKLIRTAQREGRIILTRDRHLPARTLWEAVVVVEETNYAKQLRELRRKIRLPHGSLFTRCLDCNEPIRSLPKSKVQTRVPREIYDSYADFFTCPACRKVFWRGSHVKNSEARLRRLRRP